MSTFLLSWVAAAAISAADYVPVYEEPRHRLMYDGHGIRVLDLLIPTGDTTLFHVHDSPIFYVTLSAGPVRTQEAGEDWITPSVRPSEPGSVRFNDSYEKMPVIHRVMNAGTNSIRSILVLNEMPASQPPGVYTDLNLPGTTEIDSHRFRQSRFTLAGGASLDWAGADAPVVFVLINANHVVVVDSEHGYRLGLHSPGDHIVLRLSQGLRFENRGTDAATIVAVAVL